MFPSKSELKQANYVKILGITFDCKLTRKTHITNLKSECTSRLNILRIITVKNLRADQKTIVKTYRPFIRSKMDYESITIKILDSIYHLSLRIIVGTFKILQSPPLNFLNETNESPLLVRSKILGTFQTIKNSTSPLRCVRSSSKKCKITTLNDTEHRS